MDPAISWNEAEGNPLADRNPYIGPQAVGEVVLGPLAGGGRQLHARSPPRSSTAATTWWCSVATAARSKPAAPCSIAQFCHVYRFRDGKAVTFQQYTDSAQWARLMA